MRYFLSSFICMAALVMAFNPAIAGGLRFFSSLPDIPLMHGMEEMPDYTITYDKAEGRFIESMARIDWGSIEEVKEYYDTSLPHLGWEKVADQSFVREDEALKFKVETHDKTHFLKITVEPR